LISYLTKIFYEFQNVVEWCEKKFIAKITLIDNAKTAFLAFDVDKYMTF